MNLEPPKVAQYHIPPPAALRQEVTMQQEVQQRLQELSEKIHTGNGKIKSQRGGPVDFFVNHRIKLPHEYVLAGQNKDRVTYNQLNPLAMDDWYLQKYEGRNKHANQRAYVGLCIQPFKRCE